MTAPAALEEMLAKARLVSPEYTDEELALAEARLDAKAAGRMVSGAISFDDATFHRLRRQGLRTAPGTQEDGPVGDAGDDLSQLCMLLIGEHDALHTMSTFIGGRVLEPAGARVLACVLHLAGREDSARFWWQYAAGADDVAASYCLYLHHMALGEIEEADWWQDQVDPLRGRPLGTGSADRYAHTLGWASCLHVVARRKGFTDAARAALAYVRHAVRFVDDDVDLPLPDDGFAERIEQISALV
ncbi:hypothetical protein [Actinacidiphila guanduensis]|jgi:hypothetical protein|uniref:Uncharacterized protein n=1 Tax=Actinacidiphila guanduensis TaxID=310781 RepID=A0A1G9XWA0_9ACTN|nr:hypothetical protein [Actinacidiphila guanduensis]SDN01064.1 hypothetical protein SAMN05216259_102306 [Actinacidiphila guanduensis]